MKVMDRIKEGVETYTKENTNIGAGIKVSSSENFAFFTTGIADNPKHKTFYNSKTTLLF
jgi:hypothetical protein